MDTAALQTARQEVEKLEQEMLADITEKAALLGYQLTKKEDGTTPPAPKEKRKRRTREEIQADNAVRGGTP